jgi:hypothetical protein
VGKKLLQEGDKMVDGVGDYDRGLSCNERRERKGCGYRQSRTSVWKRAKGVWYADIGLEDRTKFGVDCRSGDDA